MCRPLYPCLQNQDIGMNQLIWSLAQLQELVTHPDPSVHRWALNKLFQLYPQIASEHAPQFLADPRGVIVDEVLNHLGKSPRQELLPLLSSIYRDGAASVSAKAIQLLGEWRVAGAVDWMRERILLGAPLEEEQIASMIFALGQIPGNEARDLLKKTEPSVRETHSKYWEVFYASLLNHRQLEDVDPVLHAFMDTRQDEGRRREALGLLLAVVDPSLNPTNVYFKNHTAVTAHVRQRLAVLATSLAQARVVQFSENLETTLACASSDSQGEVTPVLETFLASIDADRAAGFEWGIARRALMVMKETGASSETFSGLLYLAVSAALTVLANETAPAPGSETSWQAKLGFLLGNRMPQPSDQRFIAEVLQSADRDALTRDLVAFLKGQSESWGALRAVEMLGILQAAAALPHLLQGLAGSRDELYRETLTSALLNLGAGAVPAVIPWLDSANPLEQATALTLLGALPTQQGVEALAERFPRLYTANPDGALNAVSETGSPLLLPAIEAEYRTGEVELARVYLHLSRVNGLNTARLPELEREIKAADALAAEQRRLFQGVASGAGWPKSVSLELACAACGKRYHYDVADLHLHPPGSNEGPRKEDFTPYRHGIVIRDDIRCKNCRRVNEVQLTAKSIAQISAESIKVLAFSKAGLKVPGYYPVKHVQWRTKEDRVITLQDSEQEHLAAVDNLPSKPSAHLALGKFYEYVKQVKQSRRAYLRVLDLDTHSVEAMAGLARLDHVDGHPEKAYEWLESCYANLEKGHYYLTEDPAAFKKAVREARREYAQELGTKPKDAPVDIRFRIEVSDHPKNKPCPCGSGKKYKLCCMPGKTTE
jgi:hypothetical protein